MPAGLGGEAVVENAAEVFPGDADAVVAHGDGDHGIGLCDANLDAAVLFGDGFDGLAPRRLRAARLCDLREGAGMVKCGDGG